LGLTEPRSGRSCMDGKRERKRSQQKEEKGGEIDFHLAIKKAASKEKHEGFDWDP